MLAISLFPCDAPFVYILLFLALYLNVKVLGVFLFYVCGTHKVVGLQFMTGAPTCYSSINNNIIVSSIKSKSRLQLEVAQ